MSRILFVTRVILFIAVCIGNFEINVARAEPILLAQLYHSSSHSDDPGVILDFSFTTAAGPGDEVRLSRVPTVADVGQTFPTDPITLARFNSVLTTSAGPRFIDSGFGAKIPMHAAVSEFFDGPFMAPFPPTHSPENNIFIMKAFVPQLGPNFSGYRLTQLTQTIDGMSIEQLNPTTFGYWGAHTIRIFGERIPEPTAGILLFQMLVCLAGNKIRFRSVLPHDGD